MKSRIQIDFTEQNDPCIVVKYEESEDVRDKLIQKFKQGLEGVSNLAQVSFLPEGKGFIITPIGIKDLEETGTHALQVIAEYNKYSTNTSTI